jgi:hypothetical protein
MWPQWFAIFLKCNTLFMAMPLDRSYLAGDTLTLQEWNGHRYTGRTATARIVHVGPGSGNMSNYVVLGIEQVADSAETAGEGTRS